MKANAPEKIYLQEPTKVRTEKKYDNDVEYTRTDAFIEKACKWLKDCLDNGMWIANDVGCAEKDAIMEHFEEYLKK